MLANLVGTYCAGLYSHAWAGWVGVIRVFMGCHSRGGGEDVVDCGWVLLIIIQYDTCRTACTTLVKGTSELEGWMDGWTH